MKLVILKTFKWSLFGLLKATKLVIVRSLFYNFSMKTKPGNTGSGISDKIRPILVIRHFCPLCYLVLPTSSEFWTWSELCLVTPLTHGLGVIESKNISWDIRQLDNWTNRVQPCTCVALSPSSIITSRRSQSTEPPLCQDLPFPSSQPDHYPNSVSVADLHHCSMLLTMANKPL